MALENITEVRMAGQVVCVSSVIQDNVVHLKVSYFVKLLSRVVTPLDFYQDVLVRGAVFPTPSLIVFYHIFFSLLV